MTRNFTPFLVDTRGWCVDVELYFALYALFLSSTLHLQDFTVLSPQTVVWLRSICILFISEFYASAKVEMLPGM